MRLSDPPPDIQKGKLNVQFVFASSVPTKKKVSSTTLTTQLQARHLQTPWAAGLAFGKVRPGPGSPRACTSKRVTVFTVLFDVRYYGNFPENQRSVRDR